MNTRRSRRSFLARLAASGGATLLAGCGLRPLYATRSDGSIGPAERGLAEINVPVIPERFGQLLRLALQSRFDHGSTGIAPRYDLSVGIGLSADILGIEQSTSAGTRLRLIGTANWRLVAQDPQRTTLANGTARSVDGLNLFDQQFFATDLENEAVQRRITEALADQITTQLAIYFKRQAGL